MTTSKQESVDNNININIRINEEYSRLVPVISESEYECLSKECRRIHLGRINLRHIQKKKDLTTEELRVDD